MIQLTVHIPSEELDALKYACAHTDEKLYIHEQKENAAMITVTLEVRGPEFLFYLVRNFDDRLQYLKTCEKVQKMIDNRRKTIKYN